MRPGRWALFSLLVVAAGLAYPPRAASAQADAITLERFHEQLALRWAPIHYQDVDRTSEDALDGKSDFVTAIDYDGDWISRNNWENLPSHPARAVAYWSVVSTDTHWYIVYAFFHPRDWCDWPGCGLVDKHENDFEGQLLIIRRPARFGPREYGRLQGIITVFHTDFYAYTPQGGARCALPASPLRSGGEDIDGALSCRVHDGVLRHVTAQEAKGHGMKAWPCIDIHGGDGVVYYPSLTASEAPDGPNDRNVTYRLVSFFAPGGVWARRNDPRTFAEFGVLAGNEGLDNRAAMPWRWNDKNDGPALPGGEMAMDPAKLARIYFTGETFSGTYLFHPYRALQRPDPAYEAWLRDN
jgi:hypothetical protein